ncbi:hypothetical protein LguiA_013474 [Lonicera macranthoides]
MANNSFFLFLFLLTAFYTATAQQRNTNITIGSSLTPTGNSSSWLSPSGLYAFGFYPQGSGLYSVGIFISGIPEKTVVWTANRNDTPVNQNATVVLTADGRLVLGPWIAETAYWESATGGTGNNVTLNLDDDGRLYLSNSSTIVKNLANGGYPKERRIYLVRNDVDGIFRVYSYNLDQQGNWSTLWRSSDDKCTVRGICGRNSYCVSVGAEAICSCIPGFDFVKPGRRNAGCTRNSVVRRCQNNNGSAAEYNMTELVNTVWLDNSYFTLTDTTKDDCKSACVKDCNCEAAVFKDGMCRMQRLPLRFGRRLLLDSNVALVKVESTPIIDRDSPAPTSEQDPPHMPKESKKEPKDQILIISVSIVAFGFIVLVISGILIYRNRVRGHQMISKKGNGKLSDDFGPRRLLVFEYMSNGSLADVLFKPENQPCWEERIRIAKDIARGILYLHEDCEMQIIHCDIKPQNILMDEYKRAKVSDFGPAKLIKPDQSKTSTSIRGTRGYVAPEWHCNLPVTVKVDVYSFGVVLLEILCRRRCVDTSLTEEEVILEHWVYQCFEDGELGKLVGDEVLDKRELDRMVKLGLLCIQDKPSTRPSMKKVLMMLEGAIDIPAPATGSVRGELKAKSIRSGGVLRKSERKTDAS